MIQDFDDLIDDWIDVLIDDHDDWIDDHEDNDYPQVQGGDNEDLGMVNYHPFYITSSRDGGYGMGLLSSS